MVAPQKRLFKIHHFRLSLLAFGLICLFTALGFWQLARAQQKSLLLKTYAERTTASPTPLQHIMQALNHHTPHNQSLGLRFYRVSLSGQFDNHHTLLLDNKTLHGEVGYEIYSLFRADNLRENVLIDRGFIKKGEDRNVLPSIKRIRGHVTINGMLNTPPAYFALGSILDKKECASGLWRVEYINLKELQPLLNVPLFPYILALSPQHSAAYPIEWQMITMPPEKHKAYAFQWFAFALTLLILFVVLNHRAGLKT